MNTIIIEDNDSAKRLLKMHLDDYCPDLKLIGEASNVKEGLELIEKSDAELVFLDVEMPDGTGFELLQKVKNIDFKVIFTTAHEKYALRAIKFSALDYILKPIDPEDLIPAVEKAQGEKQKEVSELQIKTLLYNLENANKNPQTIVLRDKYGVQFAKVDEIIRLEAEGSYTKFFIENQSPLLVSKVLKEYEQLLPTSQFFRCHQSHLINLNYLLRYDKREGDVLILKEGSVIPLANRKKEQFLKRIQTNLT